MPQDIFGLGLALLALATAASVTAGQLVGLAAFAVGLIAGALLIVVIRRNGEGRR